MKVFRFLFFVIILTSALHAHTQTVPLIKNYIIIDSIAGDLDRDGKPELVIAYNTAPINDTSYESVPRELIVYKRVHDQWKIWKRSKQALMGSRRRTNFLINQASFCSKDPTIHNKVVL